MTRSRAASSLAFGGGPLVLSALALAACSSKASGPSPSNCCLDASASSAPASSGAQSTGSDPGTPTGSGTSTPSSDVRDAGSRPLDAAHTGASSSSGASSSCSTCGRDWSAYPAVAEVDGAAELWALSDIHADYGAATKLLANSGLLASVPSTASAAEWAGGSATFVVVGDMIDKGPDAPDVVTLLMALQASAAAKGGRVVVTMGNHEAEFLANPENSSATGSDGLDTQLEADHVGVDATAAGSDALGAFLRALPIAARVDDWFFVHAGNTGGATIASLTSMIQSGVDSGGFGADVLSNANSLLEARLSSSPPQWWDATGDATTLLTTWTAALGVKHLVMGHQPGAVGISGGGADRAKATMAAEYGGLLFLIDTGMSVDVDDTGGALLHVTGVNTASEAWTEVLPSGSTMSL